MEAAELAAWLEQARTTPKGSKKELPGKMPKGYDPKAVETGWCVGWRVGMGVLDPVGRLGAGAPGSGTARVQARMHTMRSLDLRPPVALVSPVCLDRWLPHSLS